MTPNDDVLLVASRTPSQRSAERWAHGIPAKNFDRLPAHGLFEGTAEAQDQRLFRKENLKNDQMLKPLKACEYCTDQADFCLFEERMNSNILRADPDNNREKDHAAIMV